MSLSDDEIAYILVVNDLAQEFVHEADEDVLTQYFESDIEEDNDE